jgi:hypothetical protein
MCRAAQLDHMATVAAVTRLPSCEPRFLRFDRHSIRIHDPL